MAGYTRVDTGNNIADGNVISAADLDNEFDGIQAAFNANTGHNHDGTTGEGAPILVLGPTQDVVVGASTVTPKTTNTVDIGSSSLKFKDLYMAGNASIGGTLGVTGATTLSAALTYGGVTLSNAVTGTGNMVLSASPTLTGTLSGVNASLSGTLAVTGVATLTAQPVLSSLTASRAVFTDGSKGLVSNAITGTGNVVMSASPTLTGTITAEALTTSNTVTLNGGTANGVAYLNGSKVLTTGSALTFDGTTFTVPSDIASPGSPIIYSYNGGSAGSVRAGVQFVGTDPSIRSYISGSEQMRLTSTGLGIGTSSPTFTSGSGLEIERTDANATVRLQRAGTSPSSMEIRSGANTGEIFVTSNSPLLFATNGSEQMRLTSTGLGIGTSSPQGQLSLGSAASGQRGLTLDWTGAGGPYAVASFTADRGTGEVRNFAFTNFFQTWYTNNAERMRLDSSGRFLVGTTVTNFNSTITSFSDSSYTFESQRTTTGNEGHVAFVNANGAVGTIFTNGSTTAYNTSSDYRLKNITGPITTSGSYIDSLNPVEGTWKADGSTFVGLIAHEVQEASRTTVATGVKDGEQMQGMDYSSAEIIANLIAEVKALRTRVAALESI